MRLILPALLCPQKTGGRPDPSKPLKPKLVGYYTKGKVPNWSRMQEYHAWKDHVRAQVQGELPVPTREAPVRVDVTCWFPTRGGSDPENVRKGIVDALFPDGDRWVYGYHHHPLHDPANPRVEVVITRAA